MQFEHLQNLTEKFYPSLWEADKGQPKNILRNRKYFKKPKII